MSILNGLVVDTPLRGGGQPVVARRNSLGAVNNGHDL